MVVMLLCLALLGLGFRNYKLAQAYREVLEFSKKQAQVLASKEVAEARISELTFRDSLTGLYNRKSFEQELPALDRSENLPLSVMVGDLNGLKLTNDIFGHIIGDQLLIAVAKTFMEICRPQDMVFRWGGDEFVVLMPSTSMEEALEVKEQIAKCMSETTVGPIKLYVSIGCNTKVRPEQDFTLVFKRAEEEMYWNKTVGESAFQKETLDSIVQEFFRRSPVEKAHAERVSALAEEFGKFLGMPFDELCRLKQAGFLHDIGKVVLDPELLAKPYPLKPTDKQEMMRHPLVGFRLLSFFEETAHLAAVVLAHHERWDGEGYPKGIKGEEIPLLGRILAIVETYDRVLFDSFAHKFSSEQALQLIADGAGKKFDPRLTDAFLKMIKSKKTQEPSL